MSVYVLANTREECIDWCTRNHVNVAAVTCVLEPRSLRGQLRAGDQVIDARAASALAVLPPTLPKVSPQPTA